MQLETFRGRNARQVLAEVRAALGDDAWVLTSRSSSTPTARFEVVAAPYTMLVDLEFRLEGGEPSWKSRERSDQRPRVVALVGPTGAGKTTTAAKLAVHRAAYGHRRPGLLCLDTFRAAAVEQLGAYAEAAGLPMEVVYGPDDVEDALWRLGPCDVVVVDTPGRTPGSDENVEWGAVLSRLSPDEVHLVLPATFSRDAVEHLTNTYRPFGPTHLVLSKFDEAPDPASAALVALYSELRCRWVTTGQSVPGDLKPAQPHLLAALGVTAPGGLGPVGRVA